MGALAVGLANLLLWVSVIPFPTALIGDYPKNPLAGALASWLWAPLAFAVYLGIPVYFVLPHAVRARAN